MAGEGKIPAVKIEFEKIEFEKNDKIIIRIPYNQELIKKIKMISGRRGNPKGKYWEIPYSEDLIAKLQFFGENLIIDHYFHLKPLQKELFIRRYSKIKRTIKPYMRYNRDFLLFTGKKPEEIDEDIKKYLYYMVEQKKISTLTLNMIINALKFHFEDVLKKRFIYEVKQPKKIKLSVVLSKEGVERIFKALADIKHSAISVLVYSAGLRMGEVVKLKPEDIDVKRGLISKGSKGRKNRYTLLSTALHMLKKYWKRYRQQKWLFEGAKECFHISTRTAEKIFQNTCKKAGIDKEVSFHSLRHSFTTHLLEGGTDLRYIHS